MIEMNVHTNAALDYKGVGIRSLAVGFPLPACIAIWARSAYPDGAGLVIQTWRSGYPSDRLDYPFAAVLIIRSSLVYLSI